MEQNENMLVREGRVKGGISEERQPFETPDDRDGDYLSSPVPAASFK
jgi:hypothetical protein